MSIRHRRVPSGHGIDHWSRLQWLLLTRRRRLQLGHVQTSDESGTTAGGRISMSTLWTESNGVGAAEDLATTLSLDHAVQEDQSDRAEEAGEHRSADDGLKGPSIRTDSWTTAQLTRMK